MQADISFAIGALTGILGLVVGFAMVRFFSRKNARKHKADISEDESRCCQCGAVYRPLNDPDYIPEVNLCRDCLWILYYKTFFKEE